MGAIVFIPTSHWSSPSICEYLWRKTTSSFISHAPYISEEEVLTESVLENGITQLNEYFGDSWIHTTSCFSALASFIAMPTAFITIPTAVFMHSNMGILLFLFVLIGLPILFWIPQIIILLHVAELLNEADNRLHQVQLLSKQHRMDAQKSSNTSLEKILFI